MNTILSIPLLMFLPLLASIIIASPILNNAIFIRRFARGFNIIFCLYSLFFYQASGKDFIVQNIPLLNNTHLNQFGIHISFTLNPLSILMIILTTIVFTLAIISAKLFIKQHIKLFYSLILILESILIGLFTTSDIFVFFILWELELIPMYFLISIWGNKYAKKSAMKFVLYTFSGSLLVLLGILLVYYSNFAINNAFSSDINALHFKNTHTFLQVIISSLFLLGFGFKIPIVPIHRWLAEAHSDATTPVSMILAAVLLKTGVYGIIKFNLGILPLGFSILAPIIGLFAIINILWGATLAYTQINIKKIIAYSSISQMGVILLGLAALNKTGYVGRLFHMISHGIIVVGLFMVVGIIRQRCKTYNIRRLRGIACVMPKLYGFSILIAFSAMGIPFLSGFIGEFLCLYGAFYSNFQIFKLFGVISVAVLILSALYLLNLIQKVFTGCIERKNQDNQDIAKHEFIVLSTVSTLTILLGCCPFIIVNFINH